MKKQLLLSFSVILYLFGCEKASKEETWNCLQENQISPEVIATSNSIIVYSPSQAARSSGVITIENTALNSEILECTLLNV